MTINNQSFGKTMEGKEAQLWTIENKNGYSVSFTNWGATLVSMLQPNWKGEQKPVALGFQNASEYKAESGYLGATCGRFANRIAKGRFSIDGHPIKLFCNDSPNHLHGGIQGFNAVLWDAKPYTEDNLCGIMFRYVSADGEEGYPGELRVSADYSLDENNRLSMNFLAQSNAPTVVNITNHTYWNPAGTDSKSIRNLHLRLYASNYLPVNKESIPTGEIQSVEKTPFDFLEGKLIGKDLDSVPGGYDNCMIINGKPGNLRIAAELRDSLSGRTLTLYTDRPGVQFYTGNYLNGTPFPKHSALCLEPQDFPDAPNHKNFPSSLLRPGETYRHKSYIQFNAENPNPS